MGKYAFIDNIFGTDDEEETEANDAFDEEEEDDDDESGEESDKEDDDHQPAEDDAMLARLDKAYRALRAQVRAVSDLSELRTMRSEHTAALAGRQSPTLRLRTLDIIEAIAVLEAWSTRPLDERREALERLVEKITLSDGGAHVDYRVKDEQIAFHQPDPPGPPYAPMSLGLPSASMTAGSPASTEDEADRSEKSSL
jgi:hypothetical protein